MKPEDILMLIFCTIVPIIFVAYSLEIISFEVAILDLIFLGFISILNLLAQIFKALIRQIGRG